MKIGIIGLTYPRRGGISHFSTLLADKLSEKNNVTLFSLSNYCLSKAFKKKRVDPSAKPIKCKTARISEELSLNPVSWIRCGLKLRQFDCLVLNWWFLKSIPPFFVLLLFAGAKPKKVFICHEVIPPRRMLFDKFFIKRLLSMADYCVVHTKQDKEKIAELRIKSKPILLYHPIYDIFIDGKVPSAKQAKKQLNLKGNTILFFGFVRPYKGLMDLIDALPLALEEVDATLLVVGEFWEPIELYQKKIEQLGLKEKVRLFPDYIQNEEVPLFFSAADALVTPYKSISQSGVIQIALSFNKPVIATNVGGLPETILHGKTGFIVEPNNPKKLAEAIVKFYKNRKAGYFTKNIKAIKKRFDWANYANALLST